MDIEYSPVLDALSIKFKDGQSARQKKLDRVTIADFDEAGHVIGIELLHVSEQVDDPTNIRYRYVESAAAITPTPENTAESPD